jgi:hypothetical protein
MELQEIGRIKEFARMLWRGRPQWRAGETRGS